LKERQIPGQTDGGAKNRLPQVFYNFEAMT
jgi:hypothetical protein